MSSLQEFLDRVEDGARASLPDVLHPMSLVQGPMTGAFGDSVPCSWSDPKTGDEELWWNTPFSVDGDERDWFVCVWEHGGHLRTMVCGVAVGPREWGAMAHPRLTRSFTGFNSVVGDTEGVVQVDYHLSDCPNDSWRALQEIHPNGEIVLAIGRGFVGDQEVVFVQ